MIPFPVQAMFLAPVWTTTAFQVQGSVIGVVSVQELVIGFVSVQGSVIGLLPVQGLVIGFVSVQGSVIELVPVVVSCEASAVSYFRKAFSTGDALATVSAHYFVGDSPEWASAAARLWDWAWQTYDEYPALFPSTCSDVVWWELPVLRLAVFATLVLRRDWAPDCHHDHDDDEDADREHGYDRDRDCARRLSWQPRAPPPRPDGFARAACAASRG